VTIEQSSQICHYIFLFRDLIVAETPVGEQHVISTAHCFSDGAHKYQVRFEQSSQMCHHIFHHLGCHCGGGTLVGEQHVISAAHCFSGSAHNYQAIKDRAHKCAITFSNLGFGCGGGTLVGEQHFISAAHGFSDDAHNYQVTIEQSSQICHHIFLFRDLIVAETLVGEQHDISASHNYPGDFNRTHKCDMACHPCLVYDIVDNYHFKVLVGANSLSKREKYLTTFMIDISQIVKHAQYEDDDYDIAVLTLAEKARS
jgi:hypothetical protein